MFEKLYAICLLTFKIIYNTPKKILKICAICLLTAPNFCGIMKWAGPGPKKIVKKSWPARFRFLHCHKRAEHMFEQALAHLFDRTSVRSNSCSNPVIVYTTLASCMHNFRQLRVVCTTLELYEQLRLVVYTLPDNSKLYADPDSCIHNSV